MNDLHVPADFEDELRNRLTELAAVPDVAARDVGLDDALTRQRHFRSRRRFLIGAAGSAAAVAGAAAAWRVVDGREASDYVRTGSPGQGPSAADWRPIATAPLSERSRPTVVWAGDQLIVWGGFDGLSPPDGASWEPTTRSWSSIADAPAGLTADGFAVWDGAEMIVGLTESDSGADWFDRGDEEHPPVGIAAYKPTTDTWRYVTALVPRELQRQAVLAADRLVVAVRAVAPGAAGHEEDIVLVDKVLGTTRPLDPGPFAASPHSDGSGEVALTVIGSFIVATPNWDLRPWVLDLAAETWRRVSAPDSTSIYLLPATAAGITALFRESSGPGIWVLDPADRGPSAWTRGSPNPIPAPHWSFDPVWSGTELYLPGGAYDPTSDTWRPVGAPPRGKNRRRRPISLWADDSLLLFGGEEYECPDGAACDRNPGPDTLNGWSLANP
ncbi:MAG: ubiquinol-cytochrome c reductase iron-sulfur subunit N-terminal domain-containing protein [Aquihabitans sp.]